MAALRRRGDVVRDVRPTRAEPLPRTPDGMINNCALANGDVEVECQMCQGKCPDRKTLVALGRVDAAAKLNGPLTPSDRDSPEIEYAQADYDRARRQDEVEQRAGEEAFAAAAGERVEVTWGDELFQPVPFNGVRVGPFTASTVVRSGESIAEATVRLHREIASAAQKIFEEKSAAYLRNLAQIASDASKVQVP